MSTYLTPQALVVIDRADEPLNEEKIAEAVDNAVKRVLALMLQEDKPVHLAHGFPMEGDRVDIKRSDELKFEENKYVLKVGVEVALDRCHDPDYQAERLVLVKRALREYLTP